MRIEYLQFVQGANIQTSPFLMGDDMLEVLDNCVVSHKIGAILKRPGYSQVGGVMTAKPITGLHNFRQSASVQKIFATCNDATGANMILYYLKSDNTWDDIDTSTTWNAYENTKVEMEDFLSHCFFVGYDSTGSVFLPVGTLNGTTFSTATNCTHMPQGKYIKRYRDRLYVANIKNGENLYPYRVAFSDIPEAGALTWEEFYTDETGYIDVDYSEEVTGIAENWDKLMIFTEYSAYMYNQSTKKKVWDIGCSNHRTLKNSGAYMIWANQNGVWQSTGGRPQNISGRVMDFIRAGNPLNFFAEVVDEEYHLYVGTVTVNGTTYTNTDLIFNIPTQTWRWHEYYDGIEIFARYNSSGEDRLYMGTTDGEVMDLCKFTDGTLVSSDDGYNIQALFRTRAFDFGMVENYKSLIKMYAYADRAQGLNLKARVINRNSSGLIKPYKLGQLNNFSNEFTPKIEQGELLQIEGVENSMNPYFSLYGFIMDIELNTNKR